MNATVTRLAVLAPLLLAGAAHAEFRCSEPATPVDRQACAAAKQGPDALRQFVQRMNWMRHNLDFADYVDEATLLAWQQQEQPQRTVAVATTTLAALHKADCR